MRHALSFGLETEYAVTFFDESGNVLPRLPALKAMMAITERNRVSLPGKGLYDLFLGNGGRLYIDHGEHPEFATPECSSAADLVRYAYAGDRLLAELGAGLEAGDGAIARTFISKCNVDYSGTMATWGSHESYFYRRPLEKILPHLVSHLVSRVIYTGSGGFNNRLFGAEYLLSPRAVHLVSVIGVGAVARRAMVSANKASYSDERFHRLHLLCGESLCSNTAQYLRIGTTALVVMLADAGVIETDEVALREPMKALRVFASDPTCRSTVPTKRESEFSAIAIQRHYLEQVESYLHTSLLPEWGRDVCFLWRNVLDSLETNADEFETALDWRIKYALFRLHVERSSSLRWPDLSVWSEVVSQLRYVMVKTGMTTSYPGYPDGTFVKNLIRRGRLLWLLRPLGSLLDKHGQDWTGLDEFLRVRQELFELDLKFSALSGGGLFEALETRGIFRHRVPGCEPRPDDLDVPPSVGRAHFRGTTIRDLAIAHQSVYCDWSEIVDCCAKPLWAMSNPWS